MRSPLGVLPPPFPAPAPRVRDNLSWRGGRGRIGVPGAVAAGLLLPTDAVVPPRQLRLSRTLGAGAGKGGGKTPKGERIPTSACGDAKTAEREAGAGDGEVSQSKSPTVFAGVPGKVVLTTLTIRT
jgi:hypothetical protein